LISELPSTDYSCAPLDDLAISGGRARSSLCAQLRI
jgi:hypothetical protein